MLMEKLEVINVRGGSSSNFTLTSAQKGVELELEQVESMYKMYPATIPFLKLLCTLIHTPKRIALKDRVADSEPINTIPESLGQPYRHPGIEPFIKFIVDNVFAKISIREYLRPSDRWRTNDLCLCFIERSLASYDLESLISSVETQQLRGELFVPLLVHPGYDIMKRILTNSPLQASLLSYVVDGVEGFDRGYPDEEPYFQSTIVRVLRIIARVLEIQDIFIDILIPLLSEFDSAPIVGTVHSRSYFTKFDRTLSFTSRLAPAIAAYVTFPAHPEVVLLSIQIMSALAASNAFPNLMTLIEQSNDSEHILTDFRNVVDIQSMEDLAKMEIAAENSTGAGAPDHDGTSEPLE